MSDKDQHSSSPYAMYGNATTYYDSPPTTGGQGSLLDSMFPSSQAYTMNNVDSVIEFLNLRRQRVDDIAEAVKELVLRRQRMMARPNIENSAILPIPNGGAILPSREFGFDGSDLDAFQYGLGMGILHHPDALDAAGPPVSMEVIGQHQARAALSQNIQTSVTGIGARYHDKRTFTPAHATPLPSSDLGYGHADFGSARSSLPGQAISPAALTYASENRDDRAGLLVSASSRNEVGVTPVLSFMSDGIKYYRCDCGYKSARKGDLDHHLESLQHSERKYECSCGKKFTRCDSLKRHRKKCTNRGQMGLKA